MKDGPAMEGGNKGRWTPAETEAGLEGQLRESLRPVALPAGFAERVLAAAREQEASSGGAGLRPGPVLTPAPVPVALQPEDRRVVLPFRKRSALLRMVAGGALAASVLAGTFGVELERRHRESARVAAVAQRQRAAANQEFEEATRITDAALAHTREQLQRAGVFGDVGR